MDTRDLIRKLYDEGAEISDLEQGLEPEARSELRRLIEAKRAIDELPRRSPSRSSIDVVKELARATDPPRRARMSLIFGSRVVQSFAAAAAIVVAVGVGYLSLQPAAVETRQQVDMAEDAATLPPPVAMEAPGRRSNTEALSKSVPEAEMDDKMSAAPPVRSEEGIETERLDEMALLESRERQAKMASPTASEQAGNFAVGAADEAIDVPLEGFSELGWDDEKDIQAFYWKVQALSERSPDHEWEESVPLEGSFEAIKGARRDPAWLEANSQK